MPIRVTDLQRRALALEGRSVREREISFADLLYLTAEGIAEAQTKLDLSTAEVLRVLAEQRVDVVPQVTRTLDEDGRVRTEAAEPESRSLLELGFTPTRYQFEEATIELDFDVRVTESVESTREAEGRELLLRAETYEVSEHRKFAREMSQNASLSARLVSVPLPVDLLPIEDRVAEGEADVDVPEEPDE